MRRPWFSVVTTSFSALLPLLFHVPFCKIVVDRDEAFSLREKKKKSVFAVPLFARSNFVCSMCNLAVCVKHIFILHINTLTDGDECYRDKIYFMT